MNTIIPRGSDGIQRRPLRQQLTLQDVDETAQSTAQGVHRLLQRRQILFDVFGMMVVGVTFIDAERVVEQVAEEIAGGRKVLAALGNGVARTTVRHGETVADGEDVLAIDARGRYQQLPWTRDEEQDRQKTHCSGY